MSSAPFPEHFVGLDRAFEHPVTVAVTIAVAALLLLTPLVLRLLDRRVSPERRANLWARWRAWCLIAPLVVLPLLGGSALTIAAAAVLALACLREFVLVTDPERRARIPQWLAAAGLVMMMLGALDHWPELFLASIPATLALIAVTHLFAGPPEQYLARTGPLMVGFTLVAVGLGSVAWIATDAFYRPLLLMLVVCVSLHDVASYIVGSTLGRHKLAPALSPNKTVEGALGGMVVTVLLVVVAGTTAAVSPVLRDPLVLVPLGVLLAVGALLGDLLLSGVKRSLGLKDFSSALPGHGGLLDRVDSLLVAAPLALLWVNAVRGIGRDQPLRLLTGG